MLLETKAEFDQSVRCCQWALDGLCDRSWQRVRTLCPRSCGTVVCSCSSFFTKLRIIDLFSSGRRSFVQSSHRRGRDRLLRETKVPHTRLQQSPPSPDCRSTTEAGGNRGSGRGNAVVAIEQRRISTASVLQSTPFSVLSSAKGVCNRGRNPGIPKPPSALTHSRQFRKQLSFFSFPRPVTLFQFRNAIYRNKKVNTQWTIRRGWTAGSHGRLDVLLATRSLVLKAFRSRRSTENTANKHAKKSGFLTSGSKEGKEVKERIIRPYCPSIPVFATV